MRDLIQSVETKIVFTFGNGETYELPLKTNNEENLSTYGTSVKLNEQIYARSRDNIVGNIVGNTLSIDLVSLDKLLVPNNSSSRFYGYMDDTAYIDVTCRVVEENIDVFMGRYFVNTWECGNSSGTTNEVYISCVDLLSKVKNIAIGKLRLRRNISFNDYLKVVIDEVNNRLPEFMNIQYNDSDLNIWKNSDYEWQMYFNNIDRDDIETLFNCIAKYTISYIWIDRDMHIKTDHLLDDKESESVCNISGLTNLLEYGTQTGDIDKFSGIKLKYIQSVSKEDVCLLELNDIELNYGLNKLTDQKMNSDKVLDIHTVEVKTENGEASVTSFSNYKDSIDLKIRCSTRTKANIAVYGTKLNETYSTIERYKNNSRKADVAEIENRVLINALIPTYADGLMSLMSMKNSQVYASGFINPRVKVGDTVRVLGNKMAIDDYYKVIGLEFTLGSNYRCKANLIKTVKMGRNVDDILYIHNNNLLDVLGGLDVESSKYPDITTKDNQQCEEYLADELEVLRALL